MQWFNCFSEVALVFARFTLIVLFACFETHQTCPTVISYVPEDSVRIFMGVTLLSFDTTFSGFRMHSDIESFDRRIAERLDLRFGCPWFRPPRKPVPSCSDFIYISIRW